MVNIREGGAYVYSLWLSTTGHVGGLLHWICDRPLRAVWTCLGRGGFFVSTQPGFACGIIRIIRQRRKRIRGKRAWAPCGQEGMRRRREKTLFGCKAGRRKNHAMPERACAGTFPDLRGDNAATRQESVVGFMIGNHPAERARILVVRPFNCSGRFALLSPVDFEI